jgi:glycosyltransferase involved in cell wall biosynthesis
MVSGSKTKVILTEHTTFSLIPSTTRTLFKKYMAKYILPWLMRFFYPRAHAIVCVSQGVASDIREVVGNLSTISVIYNPVTSEKIYQQAKESPGSDEYLFGTHQATILAVGRLVKAKDYHTLLKAFALVLPTVKARLIILGEGPQEHDLKELVLRLNIGQYVNFLGFKSNPYAYMARASVFVLSSVREGFGNVIVEAMACRAPVIATNCKSGPGEIIEDGVNGFLVPVGDEQCLANVMIKVLQNPLLAKKITDAGYQRAKYFSIEKSAGAYEKIFSRMLAKTK